MGEIVAVDNETVTPIDDFAPWRAQAQAVARRVRRWVVLGASLLVILWLLSGLYIVQPGEQGVVLLFGSYVATSAPGINYRLPAPIQSHAVVDMQAIRRAEIGFRLLRAIVDDGAEGIALGAADEEADVHVLAPLVVERLRRAAAGDRQQGGCKSQCDGPAHPVPLRD